MEIQSTDKLLIGRNGQSFQTDFENSGIPTKYNLNEHLHKTVGGTVVGNTEYTGDITLDDHIANKGYVDSTLSNYIPITGSEDGKPVTGDIDLSTNTFLNVAGNGAGVRIKSGYWGGLKYDNQLQLEWGSQGVKMGVDINMKIGNVSGNLAESQYNGTDEFSGNSIHWLKAPEHKYDAVNKTYVDENFATTEYVDTEISNLGDLLVFKGTIDFTTTPAPTEFATGHVYANSVAGTPDPSWGLTGDVSVGDLYGRGENQWGIVGSTQSEIGDFLSVYGEKVTGATETVEYEWNENVVLASTSSENRKGITLKGVDCELSLLHDSVGDGEVTLKSGYEINLESGYNLIVDAANRIELSAGDDIQIQTKDSGHITLETESEIDFYHGGREKVRFDGDGFKLLYTIEDYEGVPDNSRNKLAPTIEYVEHIAMPKNLNTLPALG